MTAVAPVARMLRPAGEGAEERAGSRIGIDPHPAGSGAPYAPPAAGIPVTLVTVAPDNASSESGKKCSQEGGPSDVL